MRETAGVFSGPSLHGRVCCDAKGGFLNLWRCSQVLSCAEMTSSSQLWPYGWVGWHDRICFQVCLQTGACDFVPQVTRLLFSRPWMVYLSLNTELFSLLLDRLTSTLKHIMPFKWLHPLALLKGPPHSALRGIVCAKLICPVHTFPIWILDPLPPFACRNTA